MSLDSRSTTAGVQENSGNDPNTQLVPAGGGFRAGGSWQKAEEPQGSGQVDSRGSGLTAGSTWAASGGRGPAAQSWQPPEGPYLTSSAVSQRDRQLNPHEYPSLAAAATVRPNFAKQPVPSVPFASHQVRMGSNARGAAGFGNHSHWRCLSCVACPPRHSCVTTCCRVEIIAAASSWHSLTAMHAISIIKGGRLRLDSSLG